VGTNYYAKYNICEHCHRGDDYNTFHIGKSSSGWMFSLHVVERDDWNDEFYECATPRSLVTWKEFLEKPEVAIFNEYGEQVPCEEMIERITQRKPHTGRALRRHELDGEHCIEHGEGTWDLITGEFS